jgi:hypothetical protein
LTPVKLRQKTKTVPELLFGVDDSSRPDSPHFHLEHPDDIFINPMSNSHRKAYVKPLFTSSYVLLAFIKRTVLKVI